MNSAQNPSRTTKSARSSGILIQKYLITYNFVSAALWAFILIRLLLLLPLVGIKFVSGGLDPMLTYVQTLMIMDVVHSFLGLVKSPPVTAAMQVASRLLVVWGVLYPFPDVGQHWSFTTCVLAWTITEIIRYTYYGLSLMPVSTSATSALKSSGSLVPYWLTWLRYSAFYILYPMGAGSEWILILLAVPEASREISTAYSLALKASLLIYIPGFYVMFTHVLKQRSKALAKAKGIETTGTLKGFVKTD